MIWALRLLGIGQKLLDWGRSAFQWLTGAWYRLVIAALLAACLWLYVGKAAETRRADNEASRAEKNEKKYKAEAAAHVTTKVAYRKAQEIAADMYRRKVAEYEERERNHAITTDKTIRNNVNLALAGLRARQAAERAAGRTGTAQAPSATSDPNGAGGMPIVDAGDARNQNDVRICTENTAKIIGAREYLLTQP